MSAVTAMAFNKSCRSQLQEGAPLLQHRGDECCGFSVLGINNIITVPRKGKIILLLQEEIEKIGEVRIVIAHMSQKDSQPVGIDDTPMGPISLAFDGKIINREELQEKSPYLVGTDAEILVRIVAEGKNPVEGIEKIYQYVRGPFSLVLLTLEGIFVARDIFGIRPLVLGRYFGEDEFGCAVASESAALEQIGLEVVRDVRPGEIVKIDPYGFKVLRQLPSPGLRICSFEYGYWARPSSVIEGISVMLARYGAGIKLAANCPQADAVSSFPMTGNIAAEGLSYATKTPYRSVFDQNIEAGGRSFLPYRTEDRFKRAKSKLLIIKSAVEGISVVMVDDSIVEGNQIQARIHLLKTVGVKEIHLMIETPEMRHHCPFDITPRGELMAAAYTREEMRKIFGVKSLYFNSVDDFAQAIVAAQAKERREKRPVAENNLCLGCFTGEFPEY